ncbi:mRNA interferase RelE/StbE [Streptomyces sp. LaPpAH-199]|uniref:hypothetical protein n=1 Tax=Streptomyces TaxID=1883 RepID=UPI00088AA68E|nr:hypothetical protein [Streptomyces sp. LaPpAH-199]SDB93118.1 mRNA interferase RelE/StbE [Streptomyces sp. LaPpAH-199]
MGEGRETHGPTEPEGDPLGFNTTALAPQPDRRRLRGGGYRVVHVIDNGESEVRAAHAGRRPTVTAPDNL